MDMMRLGEDVSSDEQSKNEVSNNQIEQYNNDASMKNEELLSTLLI